MLDKCDYENDWHPFDSMCFKYYTNDASWTDARTSCQAARGDLAVLDTDKKLGIFTEVVNCKDLNTGIWMGLSDQVWILDHWLKNPYPPGNHHASHL